MNDRYVEEVHKGRRCIKTFNWSSQCVRACLNTHKDADAGRESHDRKNQKVQQGPLQSAPCEAMYRIPDLIPSDRGILGAPGGS